MAEQKPVEQKRHDSLAPKGAFATESAAQSERAAARAGKLVARQAADISFDEPLQGAALQHEAEITIEAEVDDNDADLCADALIPASADRVSMEDAMRALIDMRLERTRPSDDFGTFDLPHTTITQAAPHASRLIAPQAMNSLAPIELAPAPKQAAVAPQKKRSPFLWLAAAAVILLGVGVARRLDRAQPNTTQPPQAAAQLAAVDADPIAEAPAPAPEFQPTDVSESDDALLTLGTPTIVNVERGARDRANVGPAVRAAKESADPQATVAAPRVVAKAAIEPALPESPSREAIVAGFNSVRDEVLACASGNGGVAPIEATIVSAGRISHAQVGGYYQGTPQGSCIARALRKARFAPFGRESIKVSFPYTL